MSDDRRDFILDLEDLRVLLIDEGREEDVASIEAWIESLSLIRYGVKDISICLQHLSLPADC